MDEQKLKQHEKIIKIISESQDQINLDWKKINDDNMNYITTQPLRHARVFNLIGNQLSHVAIGSFAKIDLGSLQELFINYNNIGSRGCKLLSRGKWPFLRILALESCNIEDEGISHLSKASWKSLHDLNLNDNLIRERGVRSLLKSDMSKLSQIQLSYNPFSLEFAIVLCLLELNIREIILRGTIKDQELIMRTSNFLRARFQLEKDIV